MQQVCGWHGMHDGNGRGTNRVVKLHMYTFRYTT